jgi:hypothetical protein
MRIILVNSQSRKTSEPLIAHIASHLGQFGIGVEQVWKRKSPRHPYQSYAALIANADFPPDLRKKLDCFGKTSSGMPSRPQTMAWMADAGLPMMRWSLAADHQALTCLFDTWETDAILLKRSDTSRGSGVSLFGREHAADFQWDPARDLFCPEVNPDDGDIYKIELFGRDLLLGWVSHVPSARSRMEGGKLTGIYGAFGRRELFEWNESILEPACRFGAFARDHGYGHISIDLMLNPQGDFEVIEVNLGNVAIWWTCGFRMFRQRYARAIHRMLVERHDAPASRVGSFTRLRFAFLALTKKPKILVRERQGAAWRRKVSREQEIRQAGPQ